MTTSQLPLSPLTITELLDRRDRVFIDAGTCLLTAHLNPQHRNHHTDEAMRLVLPSVELTTALRARLRFIA